MKIICIGRNYLEHIQELKNEIEKEPVFFMKAENALLQNNEAFLLSEKENLGKIDYELELVLKINRTGKNILEKDAEIYYDSFGLGIDFTARQLQVELKRKGLPWEKAKAFDQSALVSSSFLAIKNFDLEKGISFSLRKNGLVVQEGNSKNMIFSFDKIIAYLSQFITLNKGDLIFTGTPKGIGKIRIADILEAYIEDKLMLKTKIK